MKKCPPPTLKTIGFLIVFVLFFHSTVFSQASYLINGRTLMLIDSVYFDINGSDTTRVDHSHITVKFDEGQEETGNTAICGMYPITNKGITTGKYYVYTVDENADIVQLINSLNSNNYVEETVISYLIPYHSVSFPNDPGGPHYQIYQGPEGYAWYLGEELIGYPEVEYLNMLGAWNYSTGNRDIKVAILDNGCDWTQTDIISGDGLGYDFIDGDLTTTPVYPSGYPGAYLDANPHGTQLTSIIASKTNNSTDIYGIAGGWNGNGGVQPVMYRVGNNDYVISANVPLAIDKAVSEGARIINMSFGSTIEDPVISIAIDQAYHNYDAIMLASAGNWTGQNPNTDIRFPASHEHVISVGGTDREDQLFYNPLEPLGFCWGEGAEISVPGIDIMTNKGYIPDAIPQIRNCPDDGTSFSCAIASGIVGLMLSVNPCLDADEVRDILYQSCRKVGGYTYINGWCEELGYGRLNAKDALHLAATQIEPGSEITSNVIWNEPKWISSSVVVKNGGSLWIKKTIKMSENAEIIVERGGELHLDGGEITSLCGGYWGGIIVHGDPLLPQIPKSNQGFLDSQFVTIRNANVGIRLCIPMPGDSPSRFVTAGGGGLLETSYSKMINCKTGINIAPYQFNNLTKINSLRITIDKMPTGGTFFSGILMNNVNGLEIKGLEVLNYSNNISQWYTGYGIRSFNCDFKLDYFCNDVDDTCKESWRVKCCFERLYFGVYAENIGTNKFVRVYNSVFKFNRWGFYGSALLMPEFLHNTFYAYDDLDQSYCLYLNNCNQYLVEDNTFTGDPYLEHADVGIYINNSGGQNNYIYSNKFNTLQFGAVADGINRDTKAGTGLCFKCNDFVGCANDIFVPLPVIPPVSRNHGIRPYQGTPGTEDTDAAGNTFSVDANYNIYNDLNPIVYVHHHYTNPQGIKIIPDARTVNTVSLFYNPGTTYKKSVSCPPEMVQGEKEELREQMAEADNGKTTTETQLAAFTDGGDTETLNSEVQTAQQSSSLTLYEELLTSSPYLSDTVMKSSIVRTDVLPDAMIRDVLVANPQSAKSGDVMNALELRPVPLPEEMKDEIKEGINIFASKDLLHGQLAYWNDRWSKAYNGLARILGKDSLSSQVFDSLTFLYNTTNTLEAKYALALLEASNGNAQTAQQVLGTITSNFILSNDEIVNHTNYSLLVNQLSILLQNNASLIVLDSASILNLLSLAEYDTYLPGALARNILHAAGYIEYTEPINLALTPKSAKVIVPDKNKSNDLEPSFSRIEVYPNPATDYCIVRYNCSTDVGNQLKIVDCSGKVIDLIYLNGNKNSMVVPLERYASGIYLISLVCQGVTVDNKELIIK